ncbi:MAG: hypothetical protein ABSD75_13805 [Terriglobales bacterium]|jgi:hypothetical protein
MSKSRKIQMTILTSRRVEIHATGIGRTWCRECDAEVEVVSLQTASLLANSLRMDLTNGAAGSDLHMPASSDGARRICLDSLLLLLSKANKLLPERW